MYLEHLYPANNMIRLRLSANLPTVKKLIQSVSPLNVCFISETKIETNFEDVKSICCKQNTEVTGCRYQCLEQLEA